MSNHNVPTAGGQAVRNIATGFVGITTGAARTGSPKIGVQYLGQPYDVLETTENLVVIELAEVTA